MLNNFLPNDHDQNRRTWSPENAFNSPDSDYETVHLIDSIDTTEVKQKPYVHPRLSGLVVPHMVLHKL